MKQLIGLAAAVGLSLSTIAPAEALTRRERDIATEYAINNSVWVLYHEVGHLFIDQFQLPVLGAREEDAADALATLMLLHQSGDEADQALRDSVDGWFQSDADFNQSQYENSDFYDPHALDIVRAYGMVCLMVGKEFIKYRPLAGKIGMDGGRISTCEYDYDLASRSWEETLKPYQLAGKKVASIDVVYDEAPRELRMFAEMARKDGLLERVAEEVMTQYSLKRSVTFRGMACDDANAFYDADLNEIQFCYEYLQFFYDLKAASLESGEGDDGDRTIDDGTINKVDTYPTGHEKLDN